MSWVIYVADQGGTMGLGSCKYDMTTAEIDNMKLESNCFGSSEARELANPMTEQKMAIHAAHLIFIMRPQMAKIIPSKFLNH